MNSAITGHYHLRRGQQIPWRGSWVSVFRPTLYRAKRKVEFDGTLYAPSDPEHNNTEVSATARSGQQIALYAYAGSANCYVGVGTHPDADGVSQPGRVQRPVLRAHPRPAVATPKEHLVGARGDHLGQRLDPLDDRVQVDIVKN